MRATTGEQPCVAGPSAAPPPQPFLAGPPAPPPPPSRLRGKAAPQYFEKDVLLNNRYRIDRLVGGGGFGQIFKAIDQESHAIVAVKVEPVSCGEEAGRIVLEKKVLAGLLECPYLPRLLGCGCHLDHNFLVMELLDRNLNEIRKKKENRRLSVPLIARVGIHCLLALRAIHNFGYLHRDLKPANVCLGRGDRKNTVVLIDLGMARQFRDVDGSLRRKRDFAAFRGTVRYVSLRVHDRKEQTPADDVVSLFYSLVELAEGELPWRALTDQEQIAASKKALSLNQLLVYTPHAFQIIYASAMQSTGSVNYDHLLEILNGFHDEEAAKTEIAACRAAFHRHS